MFLSNFLLVCTKVLGGVVVTGAGMGMGHILKCYDRAFSCDRQGAFRRAIIHADLV